MNSLLDIIQSDMEPDIDALDADYQANMFTIEQALRDTGAIKPVANYTRSPYDEELMRLINSVPMR